MKRQKTGDRSQRTRKELAKLAVREVDGGVVFVVKVVPGSSKTAVCGLLDGMVKIKISAAPEKGKANRHLLDFLAKRLGVKKNAISIISGQTSPVKHVEVLGISADVLLQKLDLEERRL